MMLLTHLLSSYILQQCHHDVNCNDCELWWQLNLQCWRPRYSAVSHLNWHFQWALKILKNNLLSCAPLMRSEENSYESSREWFAHSDIPWGVVKWPQTQSMGMTCLRYDTKCKKGFCQDCKQRVGQSCRWNGGATKSNGLLFQPTDGALWGLCPTPLLVIANTMFIIIIISICEGKLHVYMHYLSTWPMFNEHYQ